MAKKPKEIYIDDNPFYCWKYEKQTEIKHNVFYKYFDHWIKILGKYNKLNYFDCYGGCGAYADTDGNVVYGSPVEAAKIINDNHISLDRNVNIVVIEKYGGVLNNLKKVLEYSIPNVIPHFINNNFDKAINDLLNDLECKGNTLAPTFFFVDPFGYSIKMDTIERIMKVPKSEVLINFMYYRINISINNAQEKCNITNLFGTGEWEDITKLSKGEREKRIISLYIKQVKKFSKFAYAYKLQFPNMNRTYYYLVHLTNHFKGCSIMKSVFAEYNSGRLEYRGCTNNEDSLFDLPEYKVREIIDFFRRDCWKNKRLSFDQIIALIIDKTPFLEKHIRDALKRMIKQNEITRIPVTSKPTGTGLSKNDIIYFVENKNAKV